MMTPAPPIRPGRSTAGPAPPARDGAPQHFTAQLVPLDPGFYAFSLGAETARRDAVAGLVLPSIYVCAPPDQDAAIDITDGSGRAGSWLGGRRNLLLVKAPAGGAALVTAYLARDPDSAPLELEIRRIGGAPAAAGPAPIATPLLRLRWGGSATSPRAPEQVGLDTVAHIRGRGDVRFSDTPWIGRLGPGLWIEALTIVPRNPLAAAAIEYKGLTSSGAETPWLGSGSPCGTTGRGIALVGFAVRQKADATGARFDCEYTGYFQSGTTAGPTRNGAPCRSAIDNDPLEGIQLRITPRPPDPARAARS